MTINKFIKNSKYFVFSDGNLATSSSCGQSGQSTIIMALIMFAAIGSYQMYNRGIGTTTEMMAARTVKELSSGQVFSHKIINRVINIMRHAPNAKCYNGSTDALSTEGSSLLDPLQKDGYVYVFHGAHENSKPDVLEGYLAVESGLDSDFVIETSRPSDGNPNKVLRDCLVAETDLAGIQHFFIRIMKVFENASLKRYEIEVGGKAFTQESGGRSQRTSFSKDHVLNLYPASFRELGVVLKPDSLGSDGDSPGGLITVANDVQVEFDTPVILHAPDGTTPSLTHIAKSTAGDDAPWINDKIIFMRKFYVDSKKFDVSAAKTIGSLSVTFNQGITVKQFASVKSPQDSNDKKPLKQFMPSEVPGFQNTLIYHSVIAPGDGDIEPYYPYRPLSTSSTDNKLFCNNSHSHEDSIEYLTTGSRGGGSSDDDSDDASDSDGGSDGAIIVMSNKIDTRESITIDVQKHSHTCLLRKLDPLVLVTDNKVTINFPKVSDADDLSDTHFCGLVEADEIIINAGDSPDDITHNIFGSLIAKKITIEGKGNVVIRHINNNSNFQENSTFIDHLGSNAYAWFFIRDFNSLALSDNADNDVENNKLYLDKIYSSKGKCFNDPNDQSRSYYHPGFPSVTTAYDKSNRKNREKSMFIVR